MCRPGEAISMVSEGTPGRARLKDQGLLQSFALLPLRPCGVGGLLGNRACDGDPLTSLKASEGFFSAGGRERQGEGLKNPAQKYSGVGL